MKKMIFAALAVLFAVSALFVRFSPAPATKGLVSIAQAEPDHIGRLDAGIRSLQESKVILDQEAGTNYGGHRENAERLIQGAINQLHLAQDYYRHNGPY